ncbi:hypothetical protein NL676_014349 [Syzygium grande]|nr:hypothetical protein NL676_014349 [Syzygium grande]
MEKLEAGSEQGRFIGYLKESLGYYFYFHSDLKISVSRHTSFLENQFVQEGGAGRKIVLQEENDEVPNNQVQTPISDSVGAFDTQPLRRSARTSRPPARCRHLVEHVKPLFIVNDGDQLSDPNTYEEAMSDIDSGK